MWYTDAPVPTTIFSGSPTRLGLHSGSRGLTITPIGAMVRTGTVQRPGDLLARVPDHPLAACSGFRFVRPSFRRSVSPQGRGVSRAYAHQAMRACVRT